MALGCQHKAASRELKQPSLAMKVFPLPPSSAGHPKYITVPLLFSLSR